MSDDKLTTLNPLEKAVEKALAEAIERSPSLRQAPVSPIEEPVPPPVTLRQEPGLALIPEGSGSYFRCDPDSLSQHQIVGHLKSGIGTNVFNLLRSQTLNKMQRKGLRTLAITGPTEGIGKSLVSMNLALALAKQKRLDISLLDLDLRKPSLARLLDLEPETGIVDYLEGSQQLCDVRIRTQFENVSFYLGNTSRQNAAELLSTVRAQTMLPSLAPTKNHFVIADLPPILGLSDVHTFLPECDAVILVVEYSRTTRTEIEETIRLLGNVPLVGTVINRGHLSNLDVYGYGYNSEKS